jgi:VWFA-related protein
MQIRGIFYGSKTHSGRRLAMLRLAVVACALLGACVFANGQQPGADQPGTIQVNVNLTVLHAAVLDQSGHFVSGLEKQDFAVFLDGQPRPITVFQKDDAPVTAGILVDNSASMIPRGPEVLAAALAFARASNPQDEMFVVHFSDRVRLGLPPDKPFTGSISELEAALSQFVPAGATALYDAVALALSHLRASPLERKVLLIISDGGDNSSHISFSEVLDLLQRSGAVVYAVGLYDDTDRDRNPRALSQLAELTGGKAYFPSELKDVGKVCVDIARDIRLQYTLGVEGPEDGQYHRIRVTARDPRNGELEVRTRTGFFAPKR